MAFRLWALVPLLIGIVATVVSVWLGTEYFKLVKPFFHVALFSFYWASTKKFNLIVLLFLATTMVAEFLAATDFMEYLVPIMLLFTAYFAIGTYLQYPILKATKTTKLRTIDIWAGLGGIFLLVYIILTVFVVSVKEIEAFTLFSIATLVFSAFIATAFYIAGFHKHPKKIFIFIVGVCYVIICSGSLIYELQFPSVYLLGLVNLSEVIAQMSFIFFMIYRDELLQQKTWLI